MRRLGQYGTFGLPDFDGGASDWLPLVETARRRGLSFRPFGMVFCYDSPTLAPPHLQSLDACVPLAMRQVRPFGAALVASILPAGCMVRSSIAVR
jgi:hypothetical protein